MIDKDLLKVDDLDLGPLDFDLGPVDFETDFSPELLDSEPISPDAVSIGDPEAALRAALANATPAAIRSATKAVRYLEWKLGR
jgi:hypothetical protein